MACKLNAKKGTDYLIKMVDRLSSDNLISEVTDSIATTSIGFQSIMKDIDKGDGRENIADYLDETFQEVLNDLEVETELSSTVKEMMDGVLNSPEIKEKFIDELVLRISAHESTPTVDEYQGTYITPHDIKMVMDDINDSNSDTEGDTHTHILPETRQAVLRYDFAEYHVRQQGLVADNIVLADNRKPLDTRVITDTEMMENYFNGIEDLYTNDFEPFMISLVMKTRLKYLAQETEWDAPIPAQQIMEEVKTHLEAIREGVAVSIDKVRHGKAPRPEVLAYYATVALYELPSVLNNSVKIIITDKHGEFIGNTNNDRVREGWTGDASTIPAYQADEEMHAYLTTTERLVSDGTHKGKKVYKQDENFPMASKKDVYRIAQYLLSEWGISLGEQGNSLTVDIMEKFKHPYNPNKIKTEHRQDYEMLHSMYLRFFSNQEYYVRRPHQVNQTSDTVSKYGLTLERGLPAEVKNGINLAGLSHNPAATSNIRSIGISLLSQMNSIAPRGRLTIANSTPTYKSGVTTEKRWAIEDLLADNLISDGEVKLTSDTIWVDKLPPESPSKYVIKVKLDAKSEPLEFTFKGPIGNSQANAGIALSDEMTTMISSVNDEGTVSKESEVSKLLSNKPLLRTLLRRLYMPSNITSFDFLNAYEKATMGNVSANTKLGHVIGNIVFFTAMNVDGNAAKLRKIDKSVLGKITEENIMSIYSTEVTNDHDVDGMDRSEGNFLTWNPLKALYKAAKKINKVLNNINGRTSSDSYRDIGKGSENGNAPKSASSQMAIRQKISNKRKYPAGTEVKGYTIYPKLADIKSGSIRSGNTVKNISNFTGFEHLNSLLNGPFLGVLDAHNGTKAAFALTPATDTSQYGNLIMEHTEGFLIDDKVDIIKAKARQKRAVNYHIGYYSSLKKNILSTWSDFLRDTVGVDESIVKQIKSLSSLDKHLIENPIPYELVRAHLTEEIDYVKDGDSVMIKPEAIYLMDKIFSQTTYEAAEATILEGEEAFLNSDEFIRFRGNGKSKPAQLGPSNLVAVQKELAQPNLNAHHAAIIVGKSYFWNHTIFSEMGSRLTIGDVLHFPSGIKGRQKPEDFYESITEEELSELESPEQFDAAVNKKMHGIAMTAMMKQRAKRNNNTGSMSVITSTPSDSSNPEDMRSMILAYDPSKPEHLKGGFHTVIFEEVKLARDILGSLDNSVLGDIYDGVQWITPMMAAQLNEGLATSNRSTKGSAFKMTNNELQGHVHKGHKNSYQQIFTAENLKMSPKLRWLLKMAYTKMNFSEDGPITVMLPATRYDAGTQSVVVESTDTGEFNMVPKQITNMYDLYNHFGGVLGTDVYNNMDLHEFIHEFIFSGELDSRVEGDAKSGFTASMVNKYVGTIGTTNSVKFGNSKVNSASLLDINAPIENIQTETVDPLSMGSILNPHKDIEGASTSIFTQVMRNIGIGGFNTKESDNIHEAISTAADIGFNIEVEDSIDLLGVALLISDTKANEADRKLPVEIHEQVNAVLTSSAMSGGLTEASLGQLIGIVQVESEEVLKLATEEYFNEKTENSLFYLDTKKEVLDSFKKKYTRLSSKQIKPVAEGRFNSDVTKASIRQRFNSAPAVLGPSHGLVDVFNVSTTSGHESVTTWGDYGLSSHGVYRDVTNRGAAYKPYMTMDTPVAHEDHPSVKVVADFVYTILNDSQGTLTFDQAYEQGLDDILFSTGWTLKVPDITQKRDLEYSTYYKRRFDPIKGKIVLDTIDSKDDKGLPLKRELISIYNTPAFEELNSIRESKIVSIPVDDNKAFISDEMSAKDQALQYIGARYGRVKDGTLFGFDGKVFVYKEDGTFVTYKQEHGKEYASVNKYSKKTFDFYTLLSGTEITWKEYRQGITSGFDLNDQIHFMRVRYSQDKVQSELYDHIYTLDVTGVDGIVKTIEIKDNFETRQEFDTHEDGLVPGYYYVEGNLMEKGGMEAVEPIPGNEIIKLSTWALDSTEVIARPKFMKQYFIDEGDAIGVIKGQVDYKDVSELEHRMIYDAWLETNSEQAKIAYQETPEYVVYEKYFNEKLTDLLNDASEENSPAKIFESDFQLEGSETEESFKKKIDDELALIEELEKKNPEYGSEINSRRRQLLKTRTIESDSLAMARVVTRYHEALASMKQRFIATSSENRAMSYNAAHDFFFTRVPAQDKQSYSRGRILAYSYNMSNTILTPADLILVSGADYDIDKLYTLYYNISIKGELRLLPPELMDNPAATEADEEGELSTVIQSNIENEVSRFAAGLTSDAIYGPGQELQYAEAVFNYRKSRSRYYQTALQNRVLTGLNKIVGNKKEFKRSETAITTENLERLAEKYGVSEDIILNTMDVVSNFKLNIQGAAGQGMIGVVANIMKIHSLIYKAASKFRLPSLSAVAPKTSMSTYLQEDANDIEKVLKQASPDLHEKIFTQNEEGLFQLYFKNEDGTLDVVTSTGVADIARAREDVFHKKDEALRLHKLRFSKSISESKPQNIELEAQYILDRAGFESTDIQRQNVNFEVWEIFSELLSAATDNAKKLLLHKLGLDYTSMNLLGTMLTMGFDADTAFRFINQEYVQETIKTSTDSFDTTNWNAEKKSLRQIINWDLRKFKNKETYKVTSGTSAFKRTKKTEDGVLRSNFSVDVENISTEEEYAMAVEEVVDELSSPAIQLSNLLHIEASNKIIRYHSSILKGLITDRSDVHGQLAYLEYQINEFLSGVEDTDKGKVTDHINIEELFTNLGYLQEQSDNFAQTNLPGFNFFEVMLQNIDMRTYKKIQVDAEEVFNRVQGVNKAIMAISKATTATGKAHFIQDDKAFLGYNNILEELLVGRIFDSNEEYSDVHVPGTDQSFDLRDMNKRREFLLAMPAFYDWLVDNNENNFFVNNLELPASSSLTYNDENPIRFFRSPHVDEFSPKHFIKLSRAYKALPQQVQGIFETYVKMVHLGTRSVKTYEAVLDFSHLSMFNQVRDEILASEDETLEIIANTGPLALVLRNTNALTKRSTKQFRTTQSSHVGADYQSENRSSSSYTHESAHTRMYTADLKNAPQKVDVFQSSDTNIIYAAMPEFIELADSTGGFGVIVDKMGKGTIGFDTSTGAGYTGLEALLRAGYGFHAVDYNIPGTEETGRGFVYGWEALKGHYLILDKDYNYLPEVSAEADSTMMGLLNPHLQFEMNYIKQIPKAKRALKIDFSKLSNKEKNQAYLVDSLNSQMGILTAIEQGTVYKVAVPISLKGKVPRGTVVFDRSIGGSKVEFVYEGVQKVKKGDGFFSGDVSRYGATNQAVHVYSVRRPRKTNVMTLKGHVGMNTEWDGDHDTVNFNKRADLRPVAKNIEQNNKTLFAGLDDVQNTGLDQGTIPTLIRYKWYVRNSIGTFNNVEDLVGALRARGQINIPEGSGQKAFLLKLFGLEKVNRAPLRTLLDGANIDVHVYNFQPYNVQSENVKERVQKIDSAPVLELPSNFKITLDRGVENRATLAASAAKTNIDNRQFKEVVYDDGLGDDAREALVEDIVKTINVGISNENNQLTTATIVQHSFNSKIITRGLDLTDNTAVVLKVPALTKINGWEEGMDVTGKIHAPTANMYSSITLMYLKKALMITNPSGDKPLFVYNEEKNSYQEYDFASGEFIFTSAGIPNVGTNPVVLSFNSRAGSKDVDTVGNLIKSQALDATYNPRGEREDRSGDQYFINTSLPISKGMDIVHRTNVGDQPSTDYEILHETPGVVFYQYQDDKETPDKGYRFFEELDKGVDDEGVEYNQTVARVGDTILSVDDHFSTFSSDNELVIKEYAKDGVILIESYNPTNVEGKIKAITFAIFPDPEVLKKYGNFSGASKAINLTGEIRNPATGQMEAVAIENAIFTSEEFLVRRDRNIKERKAIQAAKTKANKAYSGKVAAAYKSLIKLHPDFQAYVSSVGGELAVFKMFKTGYLVDIGTKFPKLVKEDTKGQTPIDRYVREREAANDLWKVYNDLDKVQKASILEENRSKIVQTFDPADLNLDSINPEKERVMVITDNYLSTTQGKEAIKADLMENVSLSKNYYVSDAIDRNMTLKGAIRLNLFRFNGQPNNPITFLGGKSKGAGTAEVKRMLKFLKEADNSQAETIYAALGNFEEVIGPNTTIKNLEIAEIWVKAINAYGKIPANLKFSTNLGEYISSNTGNKGISKIKLLREIQTVKAFANPRNAVVLNKYLPNLATFSNGNSVLKELNIRKGIQDLSTPSTAPAEPGSLAGKVADPMQVLTDVYRDWLIDNPKILLDIIIETGNRNIPVAITSKNGELKYLVDAANDLGFSKDLLLADTADFGITGVSNSGVTYKVLSAQDMIAKDISITKGSRFKTNVSTMSFAGRVLGTGDSFRVKGSGVNSIVLTDEAAFQALAITADEKRKIRELGDDAIIVELYRDSNALIQTGDLSKALDVGPMGDKLAERALEEGVDIDEADIEILNRGDFALIFDAESPTGQSRGQEKYNFMKAVVGDVVYTKGFTPETIVSFVGSKLTDVTLKNYTGGNYRAPFNEQDIKSYFNSQVKPYLDTVIIPKGVSVAVSGLPGVGAEISAYMRSQKGYSVDDAGNISFEHENGSTDTEVVSFNIISPNYKAFNINNGKSRVKRVSGMINAPAGVSDIDNTGNGVLTQIDSELSSQKKTQLNTYSIPEGANIVDLSYPVHGPDFDFFLGQYSKQVKSESRGFKVSNNDVFITQLAKIIVQGDPEAVQSEETTTLLSRIRDENGNFKIFNRYNGKSIPAHPATKYAIARSKYNVLALFRHNLEFDFKLTPRITKFIETAIESDINEDTYRKTYGSSIISQAEIDEISEAIVTPTGIELMMYDTVTNRNKNIDADLYPSQTYFFNRMLQLGNAALSTYYRNPKSDKPVEVTYILNTTDLNPAGSIYGTAVDSTLDQPKLKLTKLEGAFRAIYPSAFKYLSTSKEARYQFTDAAFKVYDDGNVIKTIKNPIGVLKQLQSDILTDLFEEVNIDLDSDQVTEILRGGHMDKYLNTHIKYASASNSLFNTLFKTQTWIQLPDVVDIENSLGILTHSSILGKDGILLPGGNYLTEDSHVYRAEYKGMSTEITAFTQIHESSVDRKIEHKGLADNRAGIYGKILVEGTIINGTIDVKRSSHTGRYIARNLGNGDLYEYDSQIDAWGTVSIADNDTEYAYIAARTPADMGPDTKAIFANGKSVLIDGIVKVEGNTVTSDEGWVFEFNPDTNTFSTMSPGVLGTEVKFMKEAIVLSSDPGNDFNSKSVSSKTITKVSTRIANIIGVPHRVLGSDEIAEEFGTMYADKSGFTFKEEVIINGDRATLDTPMHEFGHFYFRHIKMTDYEYFQQLKKLAFESEIADNIKEAYPELGEDTDDMAEEILTSLLGLKNQRKALSSVNAVTRAVTKIKGWLSQLLGVKNKKYDLTIDSTLAEALNSIGTQLIYGPRSILNDYTKNEKSYLNKLMDKNLTEKQAIKLLMDRGFIVKTC